MKIIARPRVRWLLFSMLLSGSLVGAPIRMSVDFAGHLRPWDGFGVNYVEAPQTRDYTKDPQEYGGFSLLSERQREEILDLIFGEEGLKPGLLKMFLDPFHEGETEAHNDNADPNDIDQSRFDHKTTTAWMRYFASRGLKKTRARGGDLSIITTLYGPPAWMTKQRFLRGRDLDPAKKYELAEYIIAWAKFLRTEEKLPVNYVALHNEGEDYVRWPEDGSTAGEARHDHNMYWPPEQMVDFLKFMRSMLDRQGLRDIGLTPGETTNWLRFHEWGYAHAIASDPVALANLGLITSHGFIALTPTRWIADWRSTGNDLIRAKRPEIHSWVTSQSWGKMTAQFVNEIRNNIYVAKVNGVIPWAVVQRPAKWVGGDPNPGTAFNVDESGNFTIQPGYHFYKQISRAGQPGMAVAHVETADSEVNLMAFARSATRQPDAFIVINTAKVSKELAIRVAGTASRSFAIYRTSNSENYQSCGEAVLHGGSLTYTAPPGSVTTFFGK